MEIKLGNKIRTLRKQKNISQEILAQYLGVSFQAVSKWESGAAMPDITLIPAIASFFGVSTDELFDYNHFEMENRVNEIISKSLPYRGVDDAKCEAILREGLKKYPGNDILLNCLIYSIPVPERSEEVIGICKSLIAGTKDDTVKYDACRILAETYHTLGQYDLTKETLEMIPEIYFTKLELAACMLSGKDKFNAAVTQKFLAADSLVEMLRRLAEYYAETGEPDKALNQLVTAKAVIESLRHDRVKGEQHGKELYQGMSGVLEEINMQIIRLSAEEGKWNLGLAQQERLI